MQGSLAPGKPEKQEFTAASSADNVKRTERNKYKVSTGLSCVEVTKELERVPYLSG